MTSMHSSLFLRGVFNSCPTPMIGWRSLALPLLRAETVNGGIRCAASGSTEGGKKVSARLSMMQQVLQEAEERARSAGSKPAPKVTLEHVTVNFARSGGPGGQNVNKVNTKVDMRFNIKNARWLGERIKEKILQMEKNRINKDGELVISSTKTRTQKGNIEDALSKLQEIIDAASYVPPPPSEEQKRRIQKLCLSFFAIPPYLTWTIYCMLLPVIFITKKACSESQHQNTHGLPSGSRGGCKTRGKCHRKSQLEGPKVAGINCKVMCFPLL